MDVFEITHDYRYLNGALKTNDFLKSIQLKSKDERVKGALPASYPIWGDYSSYTINSWGVKYYMDALIQEYKIKKNLLVEKEQEIIQ